MPYIGRSLGDGVRARYIYAATSGQTSFSGNDANGIALAYSDTLYMDVYQNGVLLKPVTDYASTTGTSVVLVTGASTSDVVEMIVYDSFAVADTVSAANGGSFAGAVSVAGAFTSLGIDDNADANAITISSGELVGIGETSPTSALHVKGGAGANVAIQSTAGSHWRIGDGVGSSNGIFVIRDHTNSGNRILVNAGGEVNLPAQPAFQVVSASTQSNIAINTNVTIVLGLENFDVGANFASNTFTAPVTGKYILNYQLRLEAVDTAAALYYIAIMSSNKNYYNIWSPKYSADLGYQTMYVSAVADMDANDTAYTLIYQSGGTAQVDLTGGEAIFSGALIC